MRLSLDAAGTSASSYAFATFHLGELARTAGDPALAAPPLPQRAGRRPDVPPGAGRSGPPRRRPRRPRHAPSATTCASCSGLPLTEYVVELGELYDGHRPAGAGRAAVRRGRPRRRRLAAANGVATDLETALFQADHGVARRGADRGAGRVGRRHSIHTADALGWALHASGRDRDALRYAAAGDPARHPGRRGCSSTAARSRRRSGCRRGARAPAATRGGSTPASARCARPPSARCWAVPDEPARACGASPSSVGAWPCSSAAAGRRQRAPAGQLHRQPLQRRRRVDRRGHGRPRARHRRDPDRASGARRSTPTATARCPGRSCARGRRPSAPTPTRTLRLTVDGRPAPLAVRSSAARTLPGQAGLPTLRLECSLRAPASVTPGRPRCGCVDTGGGRRGRLAGDDRPRRRDDAARSDVPGRTRAPALTSYPKDLLPSPLDVRSLRLSVRPGRAAARGRTSADGGRAPTGPRDPRRRPADAGLRGPAHRHRGQPAGSASSRCWRRSRSARPRGRAGPRQDDHGVLPVRPPGGRAALGRDRRAPP